jgi:colicin import membrane protein
MVDFIRQHWSYLVGALLLHVLFAGIFGLTMVTMQRTPPPVQLAIQAVIVDSSQLKRPRQQQQQRERERQQREREQQEQAAQEQQRREQEEAQKEQQQRNEAEQRAEQERQIELKQREEQEQRRLAEEQQLRERQESERKRAAEDAEKQRRADAERKRVTEIERKQKEEAERRRAADEQRSQQVRESELQRQLEEEEGENQARGSPEMAQYIAMIRQHVERRWTRPLSATTGLECEVKVAQTPAGVVLSVQVGRCNGDAAVKQSIETAVYRASPLPTPSNPRLFDRNIVFIFKPEG